MQLPAKLFIICLHLYRKFFSPDHGVFGGTLGKGYCRFFPSCSQYTIEAVSQYGLLRGGVVSLKRILKCNPFFGGGYDPLVKISKH